MANQRPSASRLFGLAALAALTTGCETVEIVAVDVASVDVEPQELAIDVGEQQQLDVELLDSDGNPLTGYPIEWSSDAPSVAVVTEDGMVQGVGAGAARISARVGGVEGAAAITVRPGPRAPDAPSRLETNVRGDNRIDLRWDDNSGNETHFVVERTTLLPVLSTFVPTFDATVPANATRFEHRGLLADTRYWFRVRACRGDVCSVSEIVSARTDD